MRRLYHHYEKWEDYQCGMWRILPKPEGDAMLQLAVDFTGNAELYGGYMLRVTEEWPIACEQNLTNENMNRKAWIGHAACQMAIGCPEYVTRAAWGTLTEQQRIAANEKAQYAIDSWLRRYLTRNLGQYALPF